MTNEAIETLRGTLGLTDADVSRTCSEAIWGDTDRIRRNARRRLARLAR